MNTYEAISQRIITAIETENTLPWRKPWRSLGRGLPKNLTTGREYRGINLLLLSVSHFNSAYWVTFKQAKDLGGHVRKGEKGCPVVFWSVLERRDQKTGDIEEIPFIRHSTLFNAAQCDGLSIPDEETVTAFDPISSCEAIVTNFTDCPRIIEEKDEAYYSPTEDLINMPIRASFESAEEYYSTLFHELAHSTGHESRLNRLQKKRSYFGSKDYSCEELCAEFAASFLCANAGIDTSTFDNSISYLQGWVSALKEKPKMLVEAAQQAQKAADYILGKNPKQAEVQ